MTNIQRQIEACNLLNETSRRLSELLKSEVEIRLIKPEIKTICYIDPELEKIASDKIISDVVEEVCNEYGTDVYEMRSESRAKSLPECRQMICLLLQRYHYNISLNGMGGVINRDHSTVLASIRKMKEFVKTDKAAKSHYGRLIERLNHLLYDTETDRAAS